ncbi:MAG: IS200/IS605 family transposase [Chitinophagaceae bacterium]|nr:IS200/IS605 family transposase [Chitinophagaceae bacterium]
MPFVRVWIHLVWSTKNRTPLLTSRLRFKVGRFLKKDSVDHDIYLDMVNGYDDHLHCLVLLKATQTIADVVKQLKGGSSKWINDGNFAKECFEWQDDYYAISVSESNLKRVRNYIKNQVKHHRTKSFSNEIKLFERLFDEK